MKTICCVCKVVLTPDENGDGRVSHGYCKAHYEAMMAEIKHQTWKEKQDDQRGKVAQD